VAIREFAHFGGSLGANRRIAATMETHDSRVIFGFELRLEGVTPDDGANFKSSPLAPAFPVDSDGIGVYDGHRRA
jgi:hypothetical protein